MARHSGGGQIVVAKIGGVLGQGQPTVVHQTRQNLILDVKRHGVQGDLSRWENETETVLYKLLLERLPRFTMVSVAHRTTLKAFHDRQLGLAPAMKG